MNNDLPASGCWNCFTFSGRGSAYRQYRFIVFAGLAASVGAGGGGRVFYSMLTGGKLYDEGRCLEKPKVPERFAQQDIPYLILHSQG